MNACTPPWSKWRTMGHLADHVNYLELGSSKDWQLMATIRAQDYTFVTNNRSDFLALHGQEPLHAGVIIIVPSVASARQRELDHARKRITINHKSLRIETVRLNDQGILLNWNVIGRKCCGVEWTIRTQ